jgi:chemotaxis methyl-accepting protein methylase
LCTNDFLGWLLEKGGVDAASYYRHALERRLPACFRSLRVSDAEAARHLLERSPELVPAALDSVLIGVTAFFRDPEVFKVLYEAVLPAMSALRTSLRICSVGCSDGQELYSVAMLLDQLGVQDSILLGLDARSQAVFRACRGFYLRTEISAVPAEFRKRHFVQHAEGYLFHSALRERPYWRVADMFTFELKESWDLILFRNVAIYLAPEAASRMWHKLTAKLAPGGVLVTGRAERPPPSLRLKKVAPCVFCRSEG